MYVFMQQYPEGYLEAQKEKERLKEEAEEETPKGKGRGKKRKAEGVNMHHNLNNLSLPYVANPQF